MHAATKYLNGHSDVIAGSLARKERVPVTSSDASRLRRGQGVIVRGRDAQGRDLVMARDYISHGIRARAQDLVTLELGPETELERLAKLGNEVGQERLTRLDRSLLVRAKDNVLVLTGRDLSTVKVVVPVTSLCPCSKEISDYGAHNQRSHVTVRVELLADISWQELVRFAEDSASSEIWPMLKRSDEKWVTERAYDNPKFVEDMVRDILASMLHSLGHQVVTAVDGRHRPRRRSGPRIPG